MKLDIAYTIYLHEYPITASDKVTWNLKDFSDFIASHIKQGYVMHTEVHKASTVVTFKKWSVDESELYATVKLRHWHDFSEAQQ